MIQLLVNTNPFLLMIINSVFVITIALLIHVRARKLIKGYITGDDTKIASMLFSVNASVMTLIFSITLFQVRSEFNHIRNSSGVEISQINDINRSISTLSVKNQKEITLKFHAYLSWLVENEFELTITQDQIDESNKRFDALRNAVLKMPPATYVEKQFRNHIMETIEKMDSNRGVRLYRKEAKISPIFYLLMFIFLLSLVFLTTFEQTKLSMIFVSAYSILGTVLLTFILTTSTYYNGKKTRGKEFYVKALVSLEEKMEEIDALPEEEQQIKEMITGEDESDKQE